MARDDGWDGEAARKIIATSLAKRDWPETEALVWDLFHRIERLWAKVDEEIAVGNVKVQIERWEQELHSR